MFSTPKQWIEHFFALHGFANQSEPLADALVAALSASGFVIVEKDQPLEQGERETLADKVRRKTSEPVDETAPTPTECRDGGEDLSKLRATLDKATADVEAWPDWKKNASTTPSPQPQELAETVTPEGLLARAALVRNKLNDSGSTARHLELAADAIQSLRTQLVEAITNHDSLREALQAYVSFDSAADRINGLDECDRRARAALSSSPTTDRVG